MIYNARQALQAMEVEEEEEVWEIRGHLQEWVLILSTLFQKFGATSRNEFWYHRKLRRQQWLWGPKKQETA